MVGRLPTVAVAALILWPVSAAVAQDAPADNRGEIGVFVTLGYGVGSPFGTAGHLGFNVVNVARTDVILRAFVTFEAVFLGPSDDAGDIAVLLGRRLNTNRGWIRGAAGLGRVSVTRFGEGRNCTLLGCEDYDELRESGWGLAVQGGAMWTPGRGRFGLGLILSGNLNGLEPLFGITLSAGLGRLR